MKYSLHLGRLLAVAVFEILLNAVRPHQTMELLIKFMSGNVYEVGRGMRPQGSRELGLKVLLPSQILK